MARSKSISGVHNTFYMSVRFAQVVVGYDSSRRPSDMTGAADPLKCSYWLSMSGIDADQYAYIYIYINFRDPPRSRRRHYLDLIVIKRDKNIIGK